MPMTRAATSATETVAPTETTGLERAVDSEIQVKNQDKMIQDEVEYEEVEEEVDDKEKEVEVKKKEEEKDVIVENIVTANVGVEIQEHADLLSLPPQGSEVFLGGIPHDATEEDLRSFCESIGEVVEVRIMKGNEPGMNKGFAFVMFRTKDLASVAMEKLDGTELKGKKIKCSSSQAKHKLFVGNIPRTWGEEDLRKVVSEAGPGVTTIELLKEPQNSNRNRGFAFIEYYNHACAEYSRLKMSKPKFKIGDNSPTVSWADPKNAVSCAASQVKAVYITNLPKDVTQDKLKDIFGVHGEITKVVLPPAKPGNENRRFGFVHFADRSCALEAVQNRDRYELDGQILDCSLAKPQTDQSSFGGSSSHKSSALPSYPPHVGYGMVGGAFGAVGMGYGAPGLAQPLLYGGRGAGAAGMPMMPMLLPDGRIGYVMQQPGVQSHVAPLQHRGGGSGGRVRGRGGRGNDGGRGSSRYNPY